MTTGGAVVYLADVSFLVALVHQTHPQAEAAAGWLDRMSSAHSVGLCRVAQMGMLRILTNRSWLKDDVLSAAEAWSAWETLLDDDRFRFLEEAAGFEKEWRRRTVRLSRGSMVETDLYLAAFAAAAGLAVLTLDRAFPRSPGVRLEIPA